MSNQELLDSLRLGHISPSIYDTAYVLRSGILNEEDQKALVKVLTESQRQDGSWGGELGYMHDRVINTLAATLALQEIGAAEPAVQRALSFLNESIPNLTEEKVETIAFELTFPALLAEAKEFSLDLPYTAKAVQYYEQLKHEKLKRIPSQIFSKVTTLTHSIEALPFDPAIDYKSLQLANGSLGNSPAATAFYLRNGGQSNVKAVQYIESFKKNSWSIPSIYPFEIFEKAWVLYHFLHAGVLHKLDYKAQTDYLWRHWQKNNGASISDSFPIIDADDTAVVYIVLKETGYPVDTSIFEQFELEKWFRCFDLERNPSISANIHVLEAMTLSVDYPGRDRTISKILSFLEHALSETWVDKWHVSPYYCASHLILALKSLNHPLMQRTFDFIYSTQNSDGGWGIRTSSFEETKYVLLALGAVSVEFQKNDMMNRARLFLSSKEQKLNTELWVDKGLYAPLKVIESLNAVT